jgi:hypothetical protein
MRRSRITPKLSAIFQGYVRSAESSGDDLAFVLDSLGVRWLADYSVKSMALAEQIFWQYSRQQAEPEIISLDDFAGLLGRYLGQCIVIAKAGKWVLSQEPNHTFGKPCVDIIGPRPLRVYPVDLAENIFRLDKSYPGAAAERPYAATLEKSLSAAGSWPKPSNDADVQE